MRKAGGRPAGGRQSIEKTSTHTQLSPRRNQNFPRNETDPPRSWLCQPCWSMRGIMTAPRTSFNKILRGFPTIVSAGERARGQEHTSIGGAQESHSPHGLTLV